MWQAFKNDLQDLVKNTGEMFFDDDGEEEEEEAEDNEEEDVAEDEESSSSNYESETSLNRDDGDDEDDGRGRGDDGSANEQNREKKTFVENENKNENEESPSNALQASNSNSVSKSSPREELDRLISLEETFTTPLLPEGERDGSNYLDEGDDIRGERTLEIQQFLSTFDLDAHSEEIQNVLQHLWEESSEGNNTDDDRGATDATTRIVHDEKIKEIGANNGKNSQISLEESTLTPLQRQYKHLVQTTQTVTHSEFWTRYYYRCDVHRIEKDLQRQQDRIALATTPQQKYQPEDQPAQARQQTQAPGNDDDENCNDSDGDDEPDIAAEFAQEAKQLSTSAINLFNRATSSAFQLASVSNADEFVGGVAMLGGVWEGATKSLGMQLALEEDEDEVYVLDDDEDADDYDEDEELEEEEEEFEDDDDLNENDYEDYNDDSDDDSHEVAFTHDDDEDDDEPRTSLTPLPSSESLDVIKLRRNLMHAEGERNDLMSIVDERNDEICRLRKILEGINQNEDSLVKHNKDAESLRREVEWLKHFLSYKNASGPDQCIEEIKSLKKILDDMKASKSLVLMLPPSQSNKICEEICDAKASIAVLEKEIQRIKSDLTNKALDKPLEDDQSALSAPNVDADANADAFLTAIEKERSIQNGLQAQIDHLQNKLHDLRTKTRADNESIFRKEQEIMEAKSKIKT